MYAGKEIPPIACIVYSFLSGCDYELYRRITRCFDGAYQELNAEMEYEVSLYSDPECTEPSRIHITPHWIAPPVIHTRTESTTSTDSIGVKILKTQNEKL